MVANRIPGKIHLGSSCSRHRRVKADALVGGDVHLVFFANRPQISHLNPFSLRSIILALVALSCCSTSRLLARRLILLEPGMIESRLHLTARSFGEPPNLWMRPSLFAFVEIAIFGFRLHLFPLFLE